MEKKIIDPLQIAQRYLNLTAGYARLLVPAKELLEISNTAISEAKKQGESQCVSHIEELAVLISRLGEIEKELALIGSDTEAAIRLLSLDSASKNIN